MKLRTNDGAALGTFDVGTKPAMVAFDGANIICSRSAVDRPTAAGSLHVSDIGAVAGRCTPNSGNGTIPADTGALMDERPA
jgi:hypothetical protein